MPRRLGQLSRQQMPPHSLVRMNMSGAEKQTTSDPSASASHSDASCTSRWSQECWKVDTLLLTIPGRNTAGLLMSAPLHK